MKRKFIKYFLITLTISSFYLLFYCYEIFLKPNIITFGNRTGEGCNLATQHLEKLENGKVACIDGAIEGNEEENETENIY